MAFKKKLYQFRPKDPKQTLEIHFTKTRKHNIQVHSLAVERGVRQMLAEKISGTYVGLWFLVAEHLRLDSWKLLMNWSGAKDVHALEPRLALQMVHEAALCVNGVRQRRSLRQKGFETLNGLPFVATDQSIHKLLDSHTIAEAQALQLALGHTRQTQGHYPAHIILLDPHRIATWSQRQMPPKKSSPSTKAQKVMQTFFAIDAESNQPLGFGIGSSATTITQASLKLLEQVDQIVQTPSLVIADTEHFTHELLHYLATHPRFTLLMPAPQRKNLMQQATTMSFTSHWAGYATAEATYQLPNHDQTLRLIMQRTGEREDDYHYYPFITSSSLPAQELMTLLFPERWNIEEFFNTQAPMGWNRAATFNLHIRFGKLSLALLAQAAIYQFRQKLPKAMQSWTAQSLAQKFFAAIDGDLRVRNDTILVTLYNAPNDKIFKEQYENLPQKLQAEGINPQVPWLFDLKVDFRFK